MSISCELALLAGQLIHFAQTKNMRSANQKTNSVPFNYFFSDVGEVGVDNACLRVGGGEGGGLRFNIN